MSAFAGVSAALSGHLNAMTNKPPVAWENASYKPVEGVTFIRETILPSDTIQGSLGSTGYDQHLGVYQVDVFAPAGKGKGEAIQMADSIADHFKRGTDLTHNGVTVRLGNVSRRSGLRDGSWWIVPVSIRYSSITEPR
jgi:hypothetical protein